jgi:hypothetical protein
MSLTQILLLVFAAAFIIGVPVAMVCSIVEHLRTPASRRRSGGSQTACIGAAMQELDRLLARPSVEHTVEAQTPVLKREDDESGD